MPPGRWESLWTQNKWSGWDASQPHSGLPSLGPNIHRGEPLAVYRDGLTSRVQFHSGRGLRGILYHTDVACKELGSQVGGTASTTAPASPNSGCSPL